MELPVVLAGRWEDSELLISWGVFGGGEEKEMVQS
jgi:hypothetical protein